jgi:DNA-binding MarR family transcriptional regulator
MTTIPKHERADQLAEVLWDLWKIWHQRSHSETAPGAITSEQYWILRELGRRGQASVSELAKARGVTNSAITMATRKMQAQGWVSRTRTQENQRVVQISLTLVGKQLWHSIRTARRSALEWMVQDLSETDRSELFRLVSKIRDVTFKSGSEGVDSHT